MYYVKIIRILTIQYIIMELSSPNNIYIHIGNRYIAVIYANI